MSNRGRIGSYIRPICGFNSTLEPDQPMCPMQQKPLWAIPTGMEVAQRDHVSGSTAFNAHLELLSASRTTLWPWSSSPSRVTRWPRLG